MNFDLMRFDLMIISHRTALNEAYFFSKYILRFVIHMYLAALPVKEMSISKMKDLNKPEGFFRRPSDLKIVDRDVAKFSVAVNDEKAAKGDAVSFPKNSVIARYLAGQVGQQRDVQRAETAFLAGRVDPGQVGKVGIGRASNNLLSLCNIKTFLTHFFVKMNFTREIC
jgi:hypothetical protein